LIFVVLDPIKAQAEIIIKLTDIYVVTGLELDNSLKNRIYPHVSEGDSCLLAAVS
jgi:hypothetical protein